MTLRDHHRGGIGAKPGLARVPRPVHYRAMVGFLLPLGWAHSEAGGTRFGFGLTPSTLVRPEGLRSYLQFRDWG